MIKQLFVELWLCMEKKELVRKRKKKTEAKFTDHALTQMKIRQITKRMIYESIKNGLKTA